MTIYATYFCDPEGHVCDPSLEQRSALTEAFPDLHSIDNDCWLFSSDDKEMDVQYIFRHVMYDVHDAGVSEGPNTWLSPVDILPANPERAFSWLTPKLRVFVEKAVEQLQHT